MTHPIYLREKARTLRVERRLTIDEIAERLALSRSTIFHWVRDLPIERQNGSPGWPTAAQRAGNKAMQMKFRLLREAAYRDGCDVFETMCAVPSFRDFVNIYLAEGYKRDRNTVSVANSDVAVVQLANRWITRLTRNKVGYAIQYHADQDLDALSVYWALNLGIDRQRIRMQRKSNSSQLAKRTWRSQYGVLTVRVGDTLLHARIQAWMDCLRRSWV